MTKLHISIEDTGHVHVRRQQSTPQGLRNVSGFSPKMSADESQDVTLLRALTVLEGKLQANRQDGASEPKDGN